MKNAGARSEFSFEFSVEHVLVCSAMKLSFSKKGQVRNISERAEAQKINRVNHRHKITFQDIVYS